MVPPAAAEGSAKARDYAQGTRMVRTGHAQGTQVLTEYSQGTRRARWHRRPALRSAASSSARTGWAHPAHICAGTGLPPAPHLRRDWTTLVRRSAPNSFLVVCSPLAHAADRRGVRVERSRPMEHPILTAFVRARSVRSLLRSCVCLSVCLFADLLVCLSVRSVVSFSCSFATRVLRGAHGVLREYSGGARRVRGCRGCGRSPAGLRPRCCCWRWRRGRAEGAAEHCRVLPSTS